jgi:hypothetical protein
MESKINRYYEANNPEALKNNFKDKIGSTAINSLNLTKIYILTTKVLHQQSLLLTD